MPVLISDNNLFGHNEFDFIFSDSHLKLLLDVMFGIKNEEKTLFLNNLERMCVLLKSNSFDYDFIHEKALIENILTKNNNNIVSIEGLVGIGKSCLLDSIKDSIDSSEFKKFIAITCIYEPIVLWTNIYDLMTSKSLLKLYYEKLYLSSKYNF